MWVHAIAARLGETTLDKRVFESRASSLTYPALPDLWRWLLHAWLGTESLGAAGASTRTGVMREDVVAALRTRVHACGFDWLDGQIEAAKVVIAGGDAPAHFFVAGKQEAWRMVLSSLQALGAQLASTGQDTPAMRMIWSVELDKRGGIEAIAPMEQRRGLRGWSKPKPLVLGKLVANEKLEPWDAKVVRAIQRDLHSVRRSTLDRAAAIIALIGHPAVVMSDAPERTVDVVEGTPEIEVVRKGEHYVMRVTPQVRAEPEADHHRYYVDSDERREQEALRCITVIRDSPQRIRVIRLSPAQRRAAGRELEPPIGGSAAGR